MDFGCQAEDNDWELPFWNEQCVHMDKRSV